MKNKYLILVTGKSGSGKSTFSKILSNMIDAEIIEFDKISHLSLKNEQIKNIILNKFGTEILINDEIDRKKLGKIVFNDFEKLNFLNNTCQKFMESKIDEIINLSNKKYFILDYSLIVKMKYYNKCNLKILLKADDKLRFSRIIKRENINLKYLQDRDNNSIDYKYYNFDEIIENNDENIQNMTIIAEKIAKKIQTSTN